LPPTRCRIPDAGIGHPIVGSHYGFPRPRLPPELKRRMEAEGVDRWQAPRRKPARRVRRRLRRLPVTTARRIADLTMAREIVEAVS
jgi:hypothetical protein